MQSENIIFKNKFDEKTSISDAKNLLEVINAGGWFF